ncbi:leucyl/phenylalanyl-tRNA--protein transferase [Desulfovibrio sp. OttesenSCG-928-A18]|nr:leucyl/phenylalanyl-tRNA--protein transferase [Desulfovibrio sp. OttesenSCG-928-A18]
MAVYRLPDTGFAFPDPAGAEADGLLAVGGDLSPHRLVAAYCAGVFPWYHEDTPIMWWSLDPRCILLPDEFHLPRSLARVLKSGAFSFSMDMAFADVIHACAEPRAGGPEGHTGTWLVPEMIEAYINLHRLGLAHSVEAWQDGQLAGGLYGVSLGSVFFGESMFYRRADASKAALAWFVGQLKAEGFSLIDCQQVTANLLRFGAKPVPRAEFQALLVRALKDPLRRGSWAHGIAAGQSLE